MASKRYQQGSIRFSKRRNAWVVRYREDVIRPDGTVVRTRPQLVWSKAEVPTLPLAKRRLAAILNRINDYAYQPARIATVSDFAKQWREEVLVKFKRSSAQAGKSHLDCHIIPKLGNLRLEQLGPENQQKFVNALAGCSRKTVLNVLSTLSSMVDTARQWGYATREIEPSKLRLPDRSEYVPSCFTRKQIEDILSIMGEPWRTFFVVLALSGMRAGEVLGLQWGDVDWERECIHIRRSAWCGKTNSTKTKGSAADIPMPGKLAETLKTYRKIWRENPVGFLFTTRNNRPPSSNKVVEYQLHPAMDALGIPHDGKRFGLHAFRHGVASMLADLGYTVEVSQKQLRHSNARTTLNYTHVSGTVVDEAMNRLADSLSLDAVGRGTGDKASRIN
jgi:integrase